MCKVALKQLKNNSTLDRPPYQRFHFYFTKRRDCTPARGSTSPSSGRASHLCMKYSRPKSNIKFWNFHSRAPLVEPLFGGSAKLHFCFHQFSLLLLMITLHYFHCIFCLLEQWHHLQHLISKKSHKNMSHQGVQESVPDFLKCLSYFLIEKHQIESSAKNRNGGTTQPNNKIKDGCSPPTR